MNTFQLDCFLAVAETLSFARAAEDLNITQPAVTHQIHSLESELNVKLFKRTTRTVEMTSAGSLLINDAKNICSIAIRAKERFKNPPEQETEVFSIGCHSYPPLFLLPQVLRLMSVRRPRLHPQLCVVPFKHLFRLLEEEEVDVIIGFKESGSGRSPGAYRELAKVPVACVCSSGNPLSGRGSVHTWDLEKEKIILTDPVKSPAAVTQLQARLLGGRSPSDLYFCESSETAIVLVKAGLGVAVLPDLLIPRDDSLMRIPVEGLEPLSFGIYYKTLQGNEPLKEFIKITKEYFSQTPPSFP